MISLVNTIYDFIQLDLITFPPMATHFGGAVALFSCGDGNSTYFVSAISMHTFVICEHPEEQHWPESEHYSFISTRKYNLDRSMTEKKPRKTWHPHLLLNILTDCPSFKHRFGCGCCSSICVSVDGTSTRSFVSVGSIRIISFPSSNSSVLLTFCICNSGFRWVWSTASTRSGPHLNDVVLRQLFEQHWWWYSH